MHRLISAAVLTLTACGGGTTPAPSVTTLEFSAAPTSLKIGSNTTLTVVAKDAQGNVVPGTTVSGVVYTTTDNIVFSRDRDASPFPLTLTLPTPPAAGVYDRGVYTYGSLIRTFGSPTSQQLNVA